MQDVMPTTPGSAKITSACRSNLIFTGSPKFLAMRSSSQLLLMPSCQRRDSTRQQPAEDHAEQSRDRGRDCCQQLGHPNSLPRSSLNGGAGARTARRVAVPRHGRSHAHAKWMVTVGARAARHVVEPRLDIGLLSPRCAASVKGGVGVAAP